MNNIKELYDELWTIYRLEGLPVKEERKLFFFKLRDAQNKAVYYDDENMKYRLDSLEKSMRDKINFLSIAYEDGRRKVAIRVAKNLLDVLDNDAISEVTGLSIGEVAELRKENNINISE